MLYRRDNQPLFDLRHFISIPFILLPLLPVMLVDITLELYHHVCFPLLGIKMVQRKNYIVFDRFKLSYINNWEKLYCYYCSYVNGFFHYATAIALETERYWCGIKHKKFPGYVEIIGHQGFAEYGDEEDFKKKYVS